MLFGTKWLLDIHIHIVSLFSPLNIHDELLIGTNEDEF